MHPFELICNRFLKPNSRKRPALKTFPCWTLLSSLAPQQN